MEGKFITLEGLERFKELLLEQVSNDYEDVSREEIRDFVFRSDFATATDEEVNNLLDEIFGN